MNVKRLRSGQVSRKVSFNLKHWTISVIMVWLCTWPGCECHILPSPGIYYMYYLNPIISRMYVTPYIACGSLIFFSWAEWSGCQSHSNLATNRFDGFITVGMSYHSNCRPKANSWQMQFVSDTPGTYITRLPPSSIASGWHCTFSVKLSHDNLK